MNRSNSLLLLGVTCISTVAVLFSEPGKAGQHPGHEPDEVLLGSFHCGASADGGFVSLTFNATGDIFGEDTFLSRSIPGSAAPDQLCDSYAEAVLASIAAGSCTAGAVQSTGDENGQARTFQFVCSDARSAIIETIANASKAFLTTP